MSLTETAEKKKRALRASLLRWYGRSARDLPWRRTCNPYRVWLSEIMLQQTRVETVIPYYERFLEAFPTVETLAAASEDQVLKRWEGLGYYRRARNLHKAARVVVDQHGGHFPRTAVELRRLPGVGRYTAGAIASIAFGEPAPVLDGNVKRVFARLFAIPEDLDEPRTTRQLWGIAEVLVSRRSPGNSNQALMELGATVCTPTAPACTRCPVRTLCQARKRELQYELPVPRKRKSVPHFEVVAGLIRRREAILLAKRRPAWMLGGLWELPGGKVEPGETRPEALRRELREKLGVEVEVGPARAKVPHGYTHFSITLHVHECTVVRGTPRANAHEGVRWIAPEGLDEYALPTSTRNAIAAAEAARQ